MADGTYELLGAATCRPSTSSRERRATASASSTRERASTAGSRRSRPTSRRFAPTRERSLLYAKGPPRINVVGAHQSGKTTLAAALIRRSPHGGFSVGAVKHTHDEYETDAPGRARLPAALRRGGEPRRPPHRPADRCPRAPRRGALAPRGDRPRDAAVDVVVVEGFQGRATDQKVEVCRTATGRADPVAAGDGEVLAVMTDRDATRLLIPRLSLRRRRRPRPDRPAHPWSRRSGVKAILVPSPAARRRSSTARRRSPCREKARSSSASGRRP